MDTISFNEFRCQIEEFYSHPLRARATQAKVRQALREIAELGIDQLDQVSPLILARWLGSRPDRSAATADSLMRSARAALTVAVEVGYLARNPFAARRQWIPRTALCGHQQSKIHHSIADVGRLLDRVSIEADEWKTQRLEALVHLVACTGIRRNEALRMQVADLDLPHLLIRVRPHGHPLKTVASRRLVPVSPQLSRVLTRWIPTVGSEWLIPSVRREIPWIGGPMGRKPLDQVRAAGLRAGIEGVSFRSLRHSFATACAGMGFGQILLKRILGHTNLTTQQYYLHDDTPALLAAGSKICFSG